MSDGAAQVSAMLASCSPWEGSSFDPRTHLVAATRLCRLAREELMTGLRAWVGDSGRREPEGTSKLVLQLRVLFLPDGGGHWPEPRLGRPVDGPPPDALPAWPLRLDGDVPVLVVSGISLGGLPSDGGEQLDFAEGRCRVRPEPPTPTDEPLLLDDGRPMVRGQLLRAVAPAYDGSAGPSSEEALADDTVWARHRAAVDALGLHWDPAALRYVAAAG